MSYINNAIKKAQKERNGQNLSYVPLVTTDDGTRRRYRVRAMLLGFAILSFFLVCTAVIWRWQEWDSEPQVPLSLQRDAAAVKVVEIPLEVPKINESTSLATEVSKIDKSASLAKSESIVASGNDVIDRQEILRTERESEQDQKDLRRLYQKAIKLQRQQQIKAAEKIYLEVLHRNAQHVQALNNLGVIYLSQKKFSKSKDMFQRAMKGDKHYVEPFYNMACLYAQLNDQQQSILHLKKAIKINGEVRRWVREDKDFNNLQDTEAFNQLLEERKR